ncbi:uncharacterized protein LOC116786939 [Chiroxiphia lanceolata]|uniref:uncharacterized protein LOC116786939 n=1 Tax=Chiroxiphia lanceolata TaxID=296741 RepID=UPI0013CEE7F5|nr:uncharacterized protein LOC116786939 [Chiroxiphia lanceolata]
MVSSSSRSIPGVRDLWEEGWDSAGILLGEAGASRGRGVVAPSAGSVSRLLPPSLRPILVVAVNRDYLYKYIPEVSKVPRILFSSELLALPRTPRAGDLHLPRASVQTSPVRPTAGTGRGREFRGNSRGPRAENGTTRSLFLPPFPFSPGRSSPRVSLALASGSRSRSWIFPFVPCLCLCLSCPTRERRRLGGVWVERPSFMDIFLDLMFSKPFLYPTPSPGTGSAPGGRGVGDIHDIRDPPPSLQGSGGVVQGESAPRNPHKSLRRLLTRPLGHGGVFPIRCCSVGASGVASPGLSVLPRGLLGSGSVGTFGSLTVKHKPGIEGPSPRKTLRLRDPKFPFKLKMNQNWWGFKLFLVSGRVGGSGNTGVPGSCQVAPEGADSIRDGPWPSQGTRGHAQFLALAHSGISPWEWPPLPSPCPS